MKQIFLIALMILNFHAFAKPASTSGQLTPVKDVQEIPSFVSKLPKCQGNDSKTWNACVGGSVLPNKNAYYGEWRDGLREGLGQLKIMAKGVSEAGRIKSDVPAIYVGEFKRGQLDGHGVWIDQTGDRYEGEFKDNVLVVERNAGVTVFGDDTDKHKKKCEAYGLKFGTNEFAQCMLNLDQMANQNLQREADRNNQKKVQRISKEPTAIDWFRLANEFAKPPQFMPEPCDSGMLLPPGQCR